MTQRTGSAGPEAQAQERHGYAEPVEVTGKPALVGFTIRAISLAGYAVELNFTGGTPASINRLCSRLFEMGFTPEERPAEPARPAQPSGPPMCPVHKRPMKAMQRADAKGRTHWCTQKSGDDYCSERA